MTFLELCQRLRIESGLSGSGPATVVGQTGESLRIVNWILAADQDVQDQHATWRFMRENFSFSCIGSPATQEYTPAAAGYTDLANWIYNDIRLYDNAADESELQYVPWDEFRMGYMYGSSRTQEGRPSIVSVKPNNSLMLWQLPNDTFTVDGEYYKKAVVMTGNTDEPQYPTRFHLIAVWRALMFYGAWAGADEKYAHGSNEYSKLMRKLELDQLERMGWGDPLA